jgi:group I intron endonuclease
MKNIEIIKKLLPLEQHKNLDKSGIYKIINLLNNKLYIGSSTNKIQRRFSSHIQLLLNNKHHAVYLQNSFNKNNQNFENYKFEIIELVEPINCIEREQYYIDLYKSYIPKFGYNISPTAGNCLGVKHTLENKIKLFEKLRTLNDDEIINIITLYNNKVSYKEISEKLGIKRSMIISIIKNKYKYVKEKYNLEINDDLRHKNLSLENIKQIYQLYEIEKKSISDIEKITNITRSIITHLIKNENLYKAQKEELDIKFNYKINRLSKIKKETLPNERKKIIKDIISEETIREIFKHKYINNKEDKEIIDFYFLKEKDYNFIIECKYQLRKYNQVYIELKTTYDLRKRKNSLSEEEIINIFDDYNSGNYLIEELNIKYNYHDTGLILNKNPKIGQYYIDIINKLELNAEHENSKNRKIRSEVMSEKNIKRSKKWRLIDPSGEEIIINNLDNYCKDKDLYSSNLVKIKNTEKTYKGWKCYEL